MRSFLAYNEEFFGVQLMTNEEFFGVQ